MGYFKQAFEGRMGRLDFTGRIISDVGADIAAIALASKLVEGFPLWVQRLIWIALAMILLATIYNIPRCSVRRLHDLDKPSSQAWLLLVPVYNIYFLLMLLFKRGAEESDGKKPETEAGTFKWVRLVMGIIALAIGVLVFSIL